jgi:hypothetical protein
MTADQHNRLIAHAKGLMADAKWLKTATLDAYRWAEWWAAMAPRRA